MEVIDNILSAVTSAKAKEYQEGEIPIENTKDVDYQEQVLRKYNCLNTNCVELFNNIYTETELKQHITYKRYSWQANNM